MEALARSKVPLFCRNTPAIARNVVLIAASFVVPSIAGPVYQSGSVTPGHVAQWTTNGTVQDGGSATNGTVTNLGLQGTGFPFCINDAPVSSESGYHQLCLGPDVNGVATLSSNAYGGASGLPFDFIINGATIPLLSVPSVSLPSGELLVGNASGLAAQQPLSGDGTLSNTGALTIGSLGGEAVSLGGPFTTSGAHSLTIDVTGTTTVTLPTSGTLATLVSPAFTGTPTAPTAAGGTNTTQIATTAFVATSFAPLNSPALTGTPTVPTASTGTNTTQAASTAFVQSSYAAPPSAGYGSTTPEPVAATTITATSTITPSQTSGIVGTTTNNNANAGSVGELISSNVPLGSAVSLSNGVAADITSVSLTAGDWTCYGDISTDPAGTTTTSGFIGWISATANTTPNAPNAGAMIEVPLSASGGAQIVLPVGNTRESVGSTTTVYLGTQVFFATSTMSAYGFIGCRRVR